MISFRRTSRCFDEKSDQFLRCGCLDEIGYQHWRFRGSCAILSMGGNFNMKKSVVTTRKSNVKSAKRYTKERSVCSKFRMLGHCEPLETRVHFESEPTSKRSPRPTTLKISIPIWCVDGWFGMRHESQLSAQSLH